jgi:hypothetical protein
MKARPRISLLTLLLLMTTAALAVALWRMGEEVVPLRASIRELREELGLITVDDSKDLMIRRGESIVSGAWKWRVHCPQEYQLRMAEGTFSEMPAEGLAAWLLSNGAQDKSIRSLPSGQFTLELSIEKFGNNWFLRTAAKGKVGGSLQLKPPADWYAELGDQIQHSDASYERVASFAPDQPMVLLYVRRGAKEQVDDSEFVEETAGPAETLVIWLEAVPPPVTQNLPPGVTPPSRISGQ